MKLARKDFQSDQEVRWCPGLRRLRHPHRDPAHAARDWASSPKTSCSCRASGARRGLPYYMNTYGVHCIHGRAPAVATGVALARPDLNVWVIGGDGDMLSIGGNHLIHALRRNVNLKILMFNNQIYGLTKGQYSPTSEVGKITKSTPFGSLDHPFNPISVALGAEASFVARTHDMDRKHMTEMFRGRNEHHGASFVEVYQNCNVFNDGAFDTILNKDARPDMLIDLKHGEPVRFGTDGEHGVVMNEFGEAKIVRVADVGVDRHPRARRDPPDPSLAFALSRLAEHPETPTPVGVFRAVDRPVVRGRDAAAARRGGRTQRPRRPRRAAALGARPGPSANRPVRELSRACGTPCRSAASGVKNVVFCGMRARSTAAARGLGHRHRAAQDRRGGGTLVDQRGDRFARRASSARSPRGAGGSTSASMTAASVAATAGCSPASAAARASGWATAIASPRPSTSPSPCSATHAGLERRRRPRACSGPRR